MSKYEVGQKWMDATKCCTAKIEAIVFIDGKEHVIYTDKNDKINIYSADYFAEDYSKLYVSYRKGEIYASDTGSLFFIVKDGNDGDCVRIGNDSRYGLGSSSDGTIESYKTRGLTFTKFEVIPYHFGRLKEALS